MRELSQVVLVKANPDIPSSNPIKGESVKTFLCFFRNSHEWSFKYRISILFILRYSNKNGEVFPRRIVSILDWLIVKEKSKLRPRNHKQSTKNISDNPML